MVSIISRIPQPQLAPHTFAFIRCNLDGVKGLTINGSHFWSAKHVRVQFCLPVLKRRGQRPGGIGDADGIYGGHAPSTVLGGDVGSDVKGGRSGVESDADGNGDGFVTSTSDARGRGEQNDQGADEFVWELEEVVDVPGEVEWGWVRPSEGLPARHVPARVVCDVPGLAYVQQLLSAHGQVMHPDTHLLVDVSMFDGKQFTEKPLKLFISEEQPTMWRCGEYRSHLSTRRPFTPLFRHHPHYPPSTSTELGRRSRHCAAPWAGLYEQGMAIRSIFVDVSHRLGAYMNLEFYLILSHVFFPPPRVPWFDSRLCRARYSPARATLL